jgi:predicted AAA+ superfamily ATPase
MPGSLPSVAYRPRVIDAELDLALHATGAVLIEGARGCGKTETARQTAKSEVRLDTDLQARAAGLVAPEVLLDGDNPRLIDEWQVVPEVWNQVRRSVDDSGGRAGLFILTGSAEGRDDATRHSGAGRILRLTMRPMSLAEMGYSSGAASLAGLLRGESPRAGDQGMGIKEIAEIIAVGGWPALQTKTVNQALTAVRSYLTESARVDLRRIEGPRHDPERVARVLRSVARYTACAIGDKPIADDASVSDDPISRQTVSEYLSALARIFVLEDLPAWAPTLRATDRVRKKPKRHFVDPSIAVAALRADPDRLVREVDTLGLLFESLVVRDLRVYAQAMGASVLHYQEQRIEADAVVECPDGRWAAFEMKLGPSQVQAGVDSLLALQRRVTGNRQGEPASLNVITGWGYAYQRPDGVNIIPIGALAP